MNEELVVQRKIRRPRRLRARRRPILHIAEILAWADAWFERTGRWPLGRSGHIPETAGEKWNSMDLALRQGLRGLRGGSSLARLLAKHRGRPLTIKRILVWADAHHRRTGRWPTLNSGAIEDAAGETWVRVDWALRFGQRGLPRGSSLSRLLARRRGVLKRHRRLPPLSIEQTLRWADAHHRRHGRWPRASSGRIAEAPGETWCKINLAMREGRRGLPGGGSLARFLAKHRGVRTYSHWPALSVEQILAWADAHHRRTGNWPTSASGSVHDAPGETWNGIAIALHKGRPRTCGRLDAGPPAGRAPGGWSSTIGGSRRGRPTRHGR